MLALLPENPSSGSERWQKPPEGVCSRMPLENAFHGSLVADALSMPGHWYYDRQALRHDYGTLDRYLPPRNPHPDSILWRSQHIPLNEQADILHDQARFWGQRGIHYHQFLEAGENTANLKLATELHHQVRTRQDYDGERWLIHYAQCMLTPGWHRDTYLEEYHRAFFNRLASGKPLLKCGIRDEHIGGLAHVPALVAALPATADWRSTVRTHVALTHRHSNLLRAADCLARLLHQITSGMGLREAIAREAGDWFSSKRAEKWSTRPDDIVIGEVLSPACYIDQAFPAALYLAWKYHDTFTDGIIANAMVGGDNCHRGVVVGALLGAANPIDSHWLEELRRPPTQPTPTRS